MDRLVPLEQRAWHSRGGLLPGSPMNALRYPLLLSLVLLHLTVASLWAHEGHDHGVAESEPVASGTVTLSDSALRNLDLETVRARKQDLEVTESLFAIIEPLPEKYVRLSARFSGRVTAITAQTGDFVKAGTALLRADPLQVGGGTVSIAAPFDGHVLGVNVALGQAFTPEETLVEFANLDRVQLRGQVYDLEVLQSIKAGLAARAVTDFAPGQPVRGRVERTAASLRPGTLSYDVFASFDNPDRLLLPNSTARLAIVTATRPGRVVIPDRALLGQLGDYFVFVRGEERNSFERRPVEVGLRAAGDAEIRSGVRTGEEVVTRGHYQLQFVPAASGAAATGQGPQPGQAALPEEHGEPPHTHGEMAHDDDHDHGHDHPHEH